MALQNQSKNKDLVSVYGTAEFVTSDVTGELDTGGLTVIKSAEVNNIIHATAWTGSTGAGGVSATTTVSLVIPKISGSISAIKLRSGAGVSTSDTNYWSFGVVNTGQAGAGTAVVVDGTAAANTTKATSGAAMVAATQRTMTLTQTGGDLVVVPGDIIVLTITKTAAATAMTLFDFEVTVTAAAIDADELVYVNEVLDSVGNIQAPTGFITVNRTGASATSGIAFNYTLKGY